MIKEKKSFVLTGYIQRSTCGCGCVSSNNFWQDGGICGTSHLSLLHRDIEKYMDKLSGAEIGSQGKSCDVKVTVVIEPLDKHDHCILNRHSFSGLGYKDNQEMRKKITEPSSSENEVHLKGEEEFANKNERKKIIEKINREISVDYLQDICDRLLFVQKTGDVSKLEDLRISLERII